MRETFIIKSAWKSVFDDLGDKQAGVLIKAIFSYMATGEKPTMQSDLEIKMAFKFICIDLDAFEDAYQNKCEVNRENGRKGADYGRLGGRPRKREITPKNPQRGNDNPENPLNDTDTDTENENENENENEKKELTPSIPPAGDGESASDGFAEVWEMYGRKGNKKTSVKRWANLKNHCREAAIKHIPLYVASTPNAQFRKNFETYLNQEAWNDEIIEKPKSSGVKVSHPAANYDNDKKFEQW